MKKFVPFAALATLATFSLVPVALHAETAGVSEGKMVYGSNGQRVAAVYHVAKDGAVQMILEGALVTVAASDVSVKDGKVTIAKTKADLLKGN